jgi:hypothetical protein
MKLGLKEAKITTAKILDPVTGPRLGFTVRAPFTIALAKKLNLEELYGPDKLLRRFPYHGVNIELTEASIVFYRAAKSKGQEFPCSAQIKEIAQQDGHATVDVKVDLTPAESVQAYAFLFAEPQPDEGWNGVGLSGTYQENLPFEGEDEAEEGDETVE